MASSKKILSMTTVLVIITILVQHFQISVLGLEILPYLLVVSFLIPSLIEYRKMKILSDKNSNLLTHNDELQQRVEQLTQNKRFLQDRVSEYKNIIKELDVFVFALDLKTNKSVLFPTMQKSRANEEMDGIYLIEENVHPEDRMYFRKMSEKWSSGQFPAFEYRSTQLNGEIRWKELRPTPILNSVGDLERVSGIIIDITERKTQEEKLTQMAFYDNLTDLPNRLMLKNHLKKVLSRAKRKDHDFAIMFLDLDGFKDVNDSLGHDVGDALLKDVSIRLTASVREEDFVSRIGGDEFIIVFEETSIEELEGITSQIIQNIGNPYYLSNKEACVTPSIGISIFPDHGDEIDSLVDHADKAMYAAKNTGKNTYRFYTPEMENEQYQSKSFIDKFRKIFQR